MADPSTISDSGFPTQVELLYSALMRAPARAGGGEPDLGGKLLYAGELDRQGRALMVAGNIAGAASLAANADAAAQKQAVRDGVADFLVTSLDEALRILKNEIRKRETVAVCVAAAPETVEREMLERGVVPDLRTPIEPAAAQDGQVLMTWRVASAPAQWLPKLDALALECLSVDDLVTRRWVRLAPRFLGRLAQGTRVLRCSSEASAAFVAGVQAAVEQGQIGTEVEIAVGQRAVIAFRPPHR